MSGLRLSADGAGAELHKAGGEGLKGTACAGYPNDPRGFGTNWHQIFLGQLLDSTRTALLDGNDGRLQRVT